MTPEALVTRLGARPETRVLVRPAGGVEMQPVVDLLDRLAAAGVTRLDLVGGRG